MTADKGKIILEVLQLMYEQACVEKQAMMWSNTFTFCCFLDSWWSEMKPTQVSTTQIQRHWGAADAAASALNVFFSVSLHTIIASPTIKNVEV